MKVAIQGQPASFHDQAAKQFFGPNVKLICCQTFKEAFAELQAGRVQRALMAIENSLYGSINEVYDLLLRHKTWISGEVYLRIEHCLLGLPDAKLSYIAEVHSQAQALAQCEQFLDNKLIHAARFEEHDTAGSAEMIKKIGDPHKAAIASEQAAKYYGLKVLARNIETHHQNYTRFVVVQRQSNVVANASKTSLVLTTRSDTEPGALQRALRALAEQELNLTMLQSRPITGRAWHYLFYVDIAAGLENVALQRALKEIRSQGCHIDILGSYTTNEKHKRK